MEQIRIQLLTQSGALKQYDEALSKLAEARVVLEIIQADGDRQTDVKKQAKDQYVNILHQKQVIESALLKLTGTDDAEEARNAIAALSTTFQYQSEMAEQQAVARTVTEIADASRTTDETDEDGERVFTRQVDALRRLNARVLAAQNRAEELATRFPLPDVSRLELAMGLVGSGPALSRG
jgi:hypothetical protein